MNKKKVNINKKFNELSDFEQQKIIDNCISFKVNIKGTKTFEEAQVASGGVLLSEIN